MSDAYRDPKMAMGYATHRPPLHRPIAARIRSRLRLPGIVLRALDIGCGSGLSTVALEALAENAVGVEPSMAMLRWAMRIAPGAGLVCGRAEELPFRSGGFDLATAAGSLNYVELERVLPEIARVLTAGGVLVIYDFSPGRSFPDADSLDLWFEEFQSRYPPPDDGWQPITKESLRELNGALRLESFEPFELPVPYDAATYASYAMTETSVQYAIAAGASAGEVRAWCDASLGMVFAGETKTVLFRGYIAYLERT